MKNARMKTMAIEAGHNKMKVTSENRRCAMKNARMKTMAMAMVMRVGVAAFLLMGGVAEAAWTPADLGANLALWLDAQDTGTITKDGSNLVGQWNDKSGKGNHVTQSTGTAKPTFVASGGVNGMQSLAFAGLARWMGRTAAITGLPAGNTNYTALVVYEYDTALGGTQGPSSYLFSFGYASTARMATIDTLTGNQRFVHFHSDVAISDPPSFENGNPNFYIARYEVDTDGTDHTEQLYFNGSFEDDQIFSAGLNLLGSFIYVNRFSGSTGLGSKAYIGEIVLVSSALGAQERQQLEGYVAHKWYGAGGLNPLPGGHPYKNIPPGTATRGTMISFR